MDEIYRVVRYIRSCRETRIDCTVTIDKAKTHLILNALSKQIPMKVKKSMSMSTFARHVVQKTLMEMLRRSAITSARCVDRQFIKKIKIWGDNMTKKFCDICGKEIENIAETWRQSLKPGEVNRIRVPNRTYAEICALCATKISRCISMMQDGFEIEYHKPTSQGDVTESNKVNN